MRLLLVTQTFFNVGFYIVVPFLASYLTHSLAAGGALVGLVLGLRTASQQGLFFLGGLLADRFGVKPVMLAGMALRVAGFVVVGSAERLGPLMVGVVLIGVAAALFSPAMEAALAASASTQQPSLGERSMTRAQLFALDHLFGRIGALLGPVLGALLIPFGFPVVAYMGAALFAGLLVLHSCILPASLDPPRSEGLFDGMRAVVRNRRFLLFALGYSGMLVAYNQQYLSLPAELDRSMGSDAALGAIFVYASVLNVALQLPITRIAGRFAASKAIVGGFVLMGAGFAAVAVAAPFGVSVPLLAILPALVMVTLLHLGQMAAMPAARDLVGVLAGERHLGSYYGVLQSFGGMAVLVSSLIVGRTLDPAHTPQAAATLPWIVLVVSMFGCAALLTWLFRRSHARRVG